MNSKYKVRRATAALAILAIGAQVSHPSAVAMSLPSPWACGPAEDTSCLHFSGYAGDPNAFVDGWGTPVTDNGNNCTNYVAFRLASAGYSGHVAGDAHNWNDDAANRDELNESSTPLPNSYAVWEASSSNGWFGHVGWVDDVRHNADGSVKEIWISESAWGSPGYSKRRIIASGSSSWPARFVHVDGVTGEATSTSADAGTIIWSTTDGPLYYKDQWGSVATLLADSTSDAAVNSRGNIVWVTSTRRMYYKAAYNSANPPLLSTNVASVGMNDAGNIVWVTATGQLYYKPAWNSVATLLATGVQSAEINDAGNIVWVTSTRRMYYKAAYNSANPPLLSTNVASVGMNDAGNIVWVTATGQLYYKPAWNSVATLLATGVQSAEINDAGNIVWVTSTRRMYYKAAYNSANPPLLSTNVASVGMNDAGNIVWVTATGQLYYKPAWNSSSPPLLSTGVQLADIA